MLQQCHQHQQHDHNNSLILLAHPKCHHQPPTTKTPRVKARPFKIGGNYRPNPSYSKHPTDKPPKVKVSPGKIGSECPTGRRPTDKPPKVKVSPRKIGELKPNPSLTTKEKTTETKNTRTDTYDTNESEYRNTVSISSLISSHPSPWRINNPKS